MTKDMIQYLSPQSNSWPHVSDLLDLYFRPFAPRRLLYLMGGYPLS